jgi:hypothetical protein
LEKKQLIEIIKKDVYTLFNYDVEDIKEHVLNVYETFENNRKILIAIKLAGEMFTYGRPFVPIEVYFRSWGEKSILRFYAYTIDDTSMNFNIDVKDELEYLDKLKIVKNKLKTFDSMPDKKEFERFWEEIGAYDFDYN